MIISAAAALILTPASLATPTSTFTANPAPHVYDWQSQSLVFNDKEGAMKQFALTTFRGKQSFVNGSFIIDGYDSD